MSLDHLRVSHNAIQPLLAVAFIDFVLLMGLLIMTTTVFARPSGIELKFPYEISQGGAEDYATTIEITSEDVIYIDGKVVTLNELRRTLAQNRFRNSLISIKVDRHSSMGRVTDIFDLCRGISGARVNVSTSL